MEIGREITRRDDIEVLAKFLICMFDLKPTQGIIMAYIYLHGPATAREIADTLKMSYNTVANVIVDLRRRGLLLAEGKAWTTPRQRRPAIVHDMPRDIRLAIQRLLERVAQIIASPAGDIP